MPSECTMHLPSLFSFFRQFQIVSNTATGNNLPSLFSFFRSSKSFKIPPECMLQRHCFQTFLFSSKSIPIPSECMLQKHCFQNNFFSSKSFQIPPQFMLQRHCFQQQKICSSKSFQILSECMLWRHCFHVFPAAPNRFKYRQTACVRDTGPAGSYTSRTSDLIIW